MIAGHLRVALAASLFASVAACASQATTDPAATAERITRAVYANDLDTAVANMDDQTKKSVTRSELGELSDKMHALGDLKSLAQRSADPDSGKYEYDANFTSGAMLVQIRIDPSGKVGAYRIAPEGAPAPSAPSAHS